MSSSNGLQSSTEILGPRATWFDRMAICLPLVFVIGAPSVIITRAIFFRYYPSHFVGDSPTISETASHPPSSDFFEFTMVLVAACIFVSWSLNWMRNRHRLNLMTQRGTGIFAASFLNWISCATGLAAGFFLVVVSIYTLNDGHDVHMMGSWAFYISQALSITFDILFVLYVRQISAEESMGRAGLLARVVVAAGIFLGSFFFLYMYETKGDASPADKYTIQLIYIGAEYFVCMLFLAYPMIAYREMRRHLRRFAQAPR